MKPGIFNRIANELSEPQNLTRAIDAQAPVRRRGGADYVPPETALQQSLASLWAEYLKLDRVGLDDNFFDVGGQSLLAMQIGLQINQRFNVEFPLEAFLTAPVLRSQADKIEQLLLEQASDSDLERLLGELE